MFCNKCGAPISEKSKYCGACGAKQGVADNPLKTRDNDRSSSTTNNKKIRVHPALSTLFVTTHAFAKKLQELLSEVDGYNSNVISVVDDNNERLANLCKEYLDKFDSLCIVGGFNDISPFQVANPSAREDHEEWCFTDALFGCSAFDEDDVESAIPNIAVSRIPILVESTIRDLLVTTELDGNAHEQFSFGVTAELWKPATEKIYNEAGLRDKTLLCAPDWKVESISEKINEIDHSNKTRLYLFNVHGGGDSTEWVGESRERKTGPIVLSPEVLKDMSDSILISEACYGGAMQYEESSIVEEFFSTKGKAFVGCSVIAYGNPGEEDMPLFSADVIALTLIKKLGEGLSIAESLKAAKINTLQNAISVCQEEELDIKLYGRYAAKAILSFNAFGCPWIKFSHRSSVSSTASTMPTDPPNTTSASVNDRLSNIRSRLNERMETRSDQIRQRLNPIRTSYRSKLPINSQLFLIGMDESLSAFRSFKDARRIENLLETKQLNITNCQFYKSDKSKSNGYLIAAAPISDSRGSRESYAIITNSKGELKAVLGSK